MSLKSLIQAGLSALVALSSSVWASPFEDLPYGQSSRLFTIHGSNTIGAELGPNLVMDFFERNGVQNVEIKNTSVENEKLISGYLDSRKARIEVFIAAHGSSTGFKGLLNGTADIAAASRPIKSSEVKNLAAQGDMRSRDAEHIVGIDGLAIVVNPDNPVSDLGLEDIARIFSGEYKDWSELGGMPGQIKVYARDDKSGTWDSFKSMVLGKQYKLIETAQRFESNSELSDRVARDRNGIGFVGLSSVRDAKLVSVSDGSANSLKPNKLTVATEDYALSRRLFMYTPEVIENPFVAEFMKFSASDEGQRVVADSGFVSQEVKAVMPEFYDELPQEFRNLTEKSKRLTINFRFDEGSAKLDNKALQDIARLVGYVKTHGEAELTLIGFGDKGPSESRAQLLSKLRAMAVRRELIRNGIYPQESLGYGEDLPVASSERENGRIKNRRVEVWVRD